MNEQINSCCILLQILGWPGANAVLYHQSTINTIIYHNNQMHWFLIGDDDTLSTHTPCTHMRIKTIVGHAIITPNLLLRPLTRHILDISWTCNADAKLNSGLARLNHPGRYGLAGFLR